MVNHTPSEGLHPSAWLSEHMPPNLDEQVLYLISVEAKKLREATKMSGQVAQTNAIEPKE
ncbi:hypothetical protein A3F36_02020 [Candidatus Peribacteria bacterium RIFCSPHIGHO2_12_FULL_55_11]|nr:MAG: hypothetical protein A3F36_02020 [Candidatus Peribacteria bacterium RIFCSPHIGHO2_12_FULL_55_11]